MKQSRPSEGNNQAIKDNLCGLKTLILVADTFTGDWNVTTSCRLTLCISNLIAYILRSDVLNYTYSGTKLLNSNPPFKRACYGQITHTTSGPASQAMDS